MAQNITLLGASYSDVPAVTLPKTGGGTASFTDVTDTTAAAADVAAGKYFYTASGVRTLGTGSGGGGGGSSDFSAFDVEIVNNYSSEILVEMAIAAEYEGIYFSMPSIQVPGNDTVTVQGIAYKGECDAVITGVNFTVSPNTIEVSGETVFITDDCTITLTPHE